MKIFIKFIKYLKPYWFKESIVFVLMIINSVSGLVFPLISKVIIDDVFPKKDMGLLVKILALLLCINVLSTVFNFVSRYLYEWVSNHIMINMRGDLFNHIIHLPVSFFDKQNTGDIVHRINNEINIIQDVVTSSLIRFIHNVLRIVGLVIALSFLNFKLFLICLTLFPLLLINIKVFHKPIQKATESVRKKSAHIIDFFIERFNNIRLIQIFNNQQYEISNLNSNLKDLFRFNMKNVVISNLNSNIGMLLISFAPILIFGLGGRQVIMGAMTLGSLIAFLQYLFYLFEPTKDLVGLYIDLVRASVSMKRVFEYYDLSPIGVHSDNTNISFKNKISFKDVHFGYNGKEVIKKLNIDIIKGSKSAIVGPSGSGKTSIINLLFKFYDPIKGSISIDEQNISNINLYQYRELFSLVPQDPLLFRDTIENNLRYGNRNIADKRMFEVTKLVDIYDYVSLQEDKFQSLIGEKGINLSGGQKQRISLARAFIKKSEIIVLDESTSSLDYNTENIILNNINKIFNDKTIIIITHRLSSIKSVDNIYYIDDGHAVEKGTHEDLMKRKGKYYNMYLKQMNEKAINENDDTKESVSVR